MELKLGRAVRECRLPISLMLAAFIVMSVVGVALIAWGFTSAAATISAVSLADGLQAQLMHRVVSDMSNRLLVTESTLRRMQRMWRNGLLSAGDKMAAARNCHYETITNQNYYGATYFTLNDGELWGSCILAGGVVGLTTSQLFPDTNGGLSFNVTFWSTNDDAGIIQELLVDTTSNFSSFDYFTLVDPMNPPEIVYSPPLAWNNEIYTTVSIGIHDPNGTFIGVQSCDLSLYYLSNFLKFVVDDTKMNITIYAINAVASGDYPLGTSTDHDLYSYAGDEVQGYTVQRTLTLEEAAGLDPDLEMLTDYLKRTTASKTLYELSTQLDLVSGAALMLTRDGREVNVVLNQARFSSNLNVVFVMFVGREVLLGRLDRARQVTIGVVLAAMIVCLAIGLLFAYTLARALNVITTDLAKLSKFQFGEVLDRKDASGKTHLRNASRFLELWRIQTAFHEVVLNFAAKMSESNKLKGHSGRSVPGPSQPQIINTRET